MHPLTLTRAGPYQPPSLILTNLVPLDFVIQGDAIYPESSGRTGNVPVLLFEHADDMFPLDIAKRIGRIGRGCAPGRCQRGELEFHRSDDRTPRHDGSTLQDISELPDIPWPVVAHKHIQCLRGYC